MLHQQNLTEPSFADYLQNVKFIGKVYLHWNSIEKKNNRHMAFLRHVRTNEWTDLFQFKFTYPMYTAVLLSVWAHFCRVRMMLWSWQFGLQLAILFSQFLRSILFMPLNFVGRKQVHLRNWTKKAKHQEIDFSDILTCHHHIIIITISLIGIHWIGCNLNCYWIRAILKMWGINIKSINR